MLPPAELAARTPAHRDRYLDLLRGLSIAVVVLGHWLLAVVWTEAGSLRADSLLQVAPATQWLTWVLQVMPVFFLVGGAVHARSWRSARRRGEPYAAWLRTRAVRLLRPAVPLLWFWVLLGPALAGVFSTELVQLAARNALLPLWFLATYLVLVALVPPLLAAVELLGLRLVALLTLLVAGVDLAVRGAGWEPVGAVGFVAVWTVPVVLGFCWEDGLLERRAVRWALPVAGFALLVVLVAAFDYAVSMVGVDGGARRSNNAPPSLALVGLAFLQTGIVLAARGPVTRWLERPRVWAAVVGVNLVAMTVYLWHLTVMVLLIGALTATSWLDVAPLSAAWWAGRPVWVALLASALAPVVALLHPIELRPPGLTSHSGPGRTLASVTAGAAGLTTVVMLGAAGPAPIVATTAVSAAVAGLGGWSRDRP